MLVKYKSSYEKIAMGLLSFIPDLKDLNTLTNEIALYQDDNNHELYLWKNNSDDFSGVVGIEVADKYIVVRWISLMPSDRGEGNSFLILDQLRKLYPQQKMMGSLDTTKLVAKWIEHNRHQTGV
ncbi:RibT protein [Agrilactobacillus composti DSM 18527 = JCM 14202]|nr:RibT protein [Agrilactobacillus composti]MCH4171106.1 N-acetyltransferase [Lactobacillus sp.]GAF39117.1 RibT protein [Agrilactobacillus composti DSM 18527 = JCM 14202]